MAFADLLEQVGSVGRFQALHVTLLSLPILMMASHNLLQNFVAAVPPHYCSAHRNISFSKLNPQDSLLITVPLDKNGKPQQCQRYAAAQWHLLVRNETIHSLEDFDYEEDDVQDVDLQECTDGWDYNMTERSSTIISDWDLVCDLRSLKQMGQTIYMGGVLVGAVVFGGLSDRFRPSFPCAWAMSAPLEHIVKSYFLQLKIIVGIVLSIIMCPRNNHTGFGRRFLLLFSNLLMAVAGTCAAFSTSFSAFCCFRFLCGMALSGLVLNSFSLIVEWIPTRVRTVVGTGTGYCYTMGQLILATLAYFIHDWRWLTLAVSLPFYVSFIYSWWFLESARWLVLNNNPEQAVKNLKVVARVNGRHEEGNKINLEMLQESMKKETLCSQNTYTALDLFRTSSMRTISLCLSAVWFSTSFAYYGLSMDLQRFGVDIYLMQVIFGAVDIPAKVVVTISMSVLGRRRSQCAALILAGVTILINQLVPFEKQTVRTTLAVLGKGCLAASFNCCYLYAGELYPTVTRQTGMGWVSMMARLGAMMSPMVLLIGEYVVWLPGLIYGAAPILTGVIAAFLPETLGSPLPDTIEDVEERGSGRRQKAPPKEKLVMKDTNQSPLNEAV